MTRKIAIAPNAFRGSLTALEAVAAIDTGLKQSLLDCETILMPLADGGDGTLDVWLSANHGERISLDVTGPLGANVRAEYGLAGQMALIEMARASGIELIEERDPLRTTTFGTGQLIRDAIERGTTEILVGIGGSATVDGGAGCLQALGARLLNNTGEDPIPFGGGTLHQLAYIDLTPLQELLAGVTIRVLCDVDNPLLGPDGAAAVFGPQKGADAATVRRLEANLAHYADVIQRDVGLDIRNMPGTGAAGGLSAGLMAGTGAELVSGVLALIQSCSYDRQLAVGDIDLLITGEGKLDNQTGGGKAPFGIAQLATRHQIPVIAFAGAVTAKVSELQQWGISAAWSIVPQVCTLEEALQQAEAWLVEAATNLGNTLHLGAWNGN